jgi:hypothetical protein
MDFFHWFPWISYWDDATVVFWERFHQQLGKLYYFSNLNLAAIIRDDSSSYNPWFQGEQENRVRSWWNLPRWLVNIYHLRYWGCIKYGNTVVKLTRNEWIFTEPKINFKNVLNIELILSISIQTFCITTEFQLNKNIEQTISRWTIHWNSGENAAFQLEHHFSTCCLDQHFHQFTNFCNSLGKIDIWMLPSAMKYLWICASQWKIYGMVNRQKLSHQEPLEPPVVHPFFQWKSHTFNEAPRHPRCYSGTWSPSP